ncbi:MAG TPA: hypothetical protein VK052_01365 [Zeimonas sp.]|nr:hypothetical protein [Zeimonas sp.]
MADVTDSMVGDGATGELRRALRMLKFWCLASVVVCAALWGAGLAASLAADASTVRMLRIAMLHPGLTVFALALGCAAFSAMRLRASMRSRDLDRLLERICYVATVTALVLLPSALLAWRWAATTRPVDGVGISLAMETIAQLVSLLLLVRNARDAFRLSTQAARRSISSIL